MALTAHLPAVGAVFLAAVITCLNAFSHFSGEVAVLYVIVLLISSDGLGPRALCLVAIACAALNIVSSIIFKDVVADADEGLRLGVSLAANALATWLLLRRAAKEARMIDGELRYEPAFNGLAIAVWEYDFRPIQSAIAEVRAMGVTNIRRYVADHPQFVIQTRAMVRITDVNLTALELFGARSKPQFFSRLDDILPKDFADCLVAIDERWSVYQTRTLVRTGTGKSIHVIVAFGLGGKGPLERVPASVFDVTRESELELAVARTRAQLDQAERSGALSLISSTLAHEINQPLSAINSYAEASIRWLDHEAPQVGEARDALVGLLNAVQHAHGVVCRVRSLVRDTAVDLHLVELGKTVASATELGRRSHGAGCVQIEFDQPEEPVWVRGDSILLSQLVINLIGNACQAMESAGSADRRVCVELKSDGKSVVLGVRDTGPGWGGVHSDEAFEAFFTTRKDGVGLGLSICRTITQLHEGEIALLKAGGGGAKVEVRLPMPEAASDLSQSVQVVSPSVAVVVRRAVQGALVPLHCSSGPTQQRSSLARSRGSPAVKERSEAHG